MFIYKSDNINPYYNLALEDYIFNNTEDECILITRNEPSILLGKNQNAYSEVDLMYTKQSQIKIARRITGGYVLYQDSGTFNFSYMLKDKNNSEQDLSKIERLIKSFFIDKFNLKVDFSPKGFVYLNRKQVGACTKIKINDKILLHGTITFNTKTNYLIKAQKISSEIFDKQKEKNTSIYANLEHKMSVEDFEIIFYEYIKYLFPYANDFYSISQEGKDEINRLIEEKYSTSNWIYGNIINHNFSKEIKSLAGNIQILMDIKDDIIKDIKIYGDFLSNAEISDIENALKGCIYERNEIANILSNYKLSDYIFHIDEKNFINYFFND